MSNFDTYKTPLDVDLFHKALFEDRFPVTRRDCVQVAQLTEDVCSKGGSYTIGCMANDVGYVINAYNSDQELVANYVINRPTIAPNRRIPTYSWLRAKFKEIGVTSDETIIRSTMKLIENNIRAGGTMDFRISSNSIHFELGMKGIKCAELSYYKQDLYL